MGNIKRHILYAVFAGFLSIAIIFSVQFFVNEINTQITNKKLAFVKNIFADNENLTNNILTSPKFFKYFLKYADSMAEKALDFEFFPRNELDNFAFIMLSLPANINVQNFEIEKDYIIIELDGNNKSEAENFAYNLSLTEKFKEIEIEENDGQFSLILTR